MHGIARARIQRMIAPIIRDWLLYKTANKENKWLFYPRDYPEFPEHDFPREKYIKVTIEMVDNPFTIGDSDD